MATPWRSPGWARYGASASCRSGWRHLASPGTFPTSIGPTSSMRRRSSTRWPAPSLDRRRGAPKHVAMPLLRRLSSIVLVLSATTAALRAQDAVVRGLDHIPLAVRDLEQSQADFEALGFVLKPGRPHANGLRNAHAKFPDGTEIELITAVSASDALSSDYVDWLKQGAAPAFRGFFALDPESA